MSKVVLTGITTTGTPHLGNYLGAIAPAIAACCHEGDTQSYYFLADLHALIKCQDPHQVAQSTREIAATWLALGLDTQQAVFYRQSDVPEISQLTWLLTCVTAKGLMNRAHAYKAAVAANEQTPGNDPDQGITMGLFSYPVLMAADILMFNAHKVPVGRDQVQHLEMARDIAARFNHLYGEHFVLPEAVVDDKAPVLPGLDGRKMSKSYHNTIPLFEPPQQLKKRILRIKTDSTLPGVAKNPDDSLLFALYQGFASPVQIAHMRQAYAQGLGWGEIKNQVFEHLDALLQAPRQRYTQLMADPAYLETVLHQGAQRARQVAAPFLQRLYQAVGIRALS